ncbi:hypothetical protein B0T21DRAFT_113036 [Apiosordaria backusii]|uniref:Uncharacterized protein n=1 Tax=Apiosordaria backusii TaxID=314023 RepID=A0AA39ZS48_9PEZI|nr:hypothetical protein B0T21DRAFT_113036 [Apiosordaria backusii]
MDALCEDIFEKDLDLEEWSDAEWNKRVPRGSWKRCNECRNKTNICEQCRFWLENYGCPRPDNTTNESSSLETTESQVIGSLHTSSRTARPYLQFSKHEVRPQTPTGASSAFQYHESGSWSPESLEASISSWTSISNLSQSFATEQDHHIRFDIQREYSREHSLGESYINLGSISHSPPLLKPTEAVDKVESCTQQVYSHQLAERHQTHSTTATIYEEHQNQYYHDAPHLLNTAIRCASLRTSHGYSYINTTTTTSRIRRQRKTPKSTPKPPSPFDSGYTHVLFSASHALSTCHVKGLWAPRPFQSERLHTSWRWKNYKRSILRHYGLPGLAEVQTRGWNGNVKGAVVGLSIVFLEWPKDVWGWVMSRRRNVIGDSIGWVKVDDGRGEVQ